MAVSDQNNPPPEPNEGSGYERAMRFLEVPEELRPLSFEFPVVMDAMVIPYELEAKLAGETALVDALLVLGQYEKLAVLLKATLFSYRTYLEMLRQKHKAGVDLKPYLTMSTPAVDVDEDPR